MSQPQRNQNHKSSYLLYWKKHPYLRPSLWYWSSRNQAFRDLPTPICQPFPSYTLGLENRAGVGLRWSPRFVMLRLCWGKNRGKLMLNDENWWDRHQKLRNVDTKFQPSILMWIFWSHSKIAFINFETYLFHKLMHENPDHTWSQLWPQFSEQVLSKIWVCLGTLEGQCYSKHF